MTHKYTCPMVNSDTVVHFSRAFLENALKNNPEAKDFKLTHTQGPATEDDVRHGLDPDKIISTWRIEPVKWVVYDTVTMKAIADLGTVTGFPEFNSLP